EVRASWSPYTPSNPIYRVWKPLKVNGWTNGLERGELRFTAPDIDFQFVVVRVQIAEAGDDTERSLLSGEISGCVVSPGQQGTASFAANKGRNAFVCGEDIELTLVLRSHKVRELGFNPLGNNREITLTHPDGHIETH